MTGEFESLYDAIRQSEYKGHAPVKFYNWWVDTPHNKNPNHDYNMNLFSTMPEEQLRVWIFQFFLGDS